MNIQTLRIRSTNAIGIVGIVLGGLAIVIEWVVQGNLGLGALAGGGSALALAVPGGR